MPEAFEKPSLFYPMMYPAWRRAEVLEGGTDYYRAVALGQESEALFDDADSKIIGDYGAEVFLPRYPNEEDEDYNWRVRQIFVSPIFQEMVGRIMREEPAYEGPLTEAELADLDLRGASLRTIARNCVQSILSRGKCHLLAEHPKNPVLEQGRPPSLADEKAFNLRPFLEVIHPKSLIGATAEQWGGARIYSSIRLLDVVFEEDHATFAQERQRRMRIYRRTADGVTFTELRQKIGGQSAQWTLTVEEKLLRARNGGAMKLIPFSTGYAQEIGFEHSRQPLEAVAWKNIEYEIVSANLRHYLSIVCHPQLTITGLTALMTNTELAKIRSPRAILQGTVGKDGGPGAQFGWIGAPTDGIAKTEEAVNRVFDEAETAGIRLLIKRPTEQTATAETLDDMTEAAPLEVIAGNSEQCLTVALAHRAAWETGEYRAEAGGKVSLSKDFTILGDDWEAMDFLLSLKNAGSLDTQTLLEEAKKRRRLRADVDIDEVMRRLKEEEAAARDAFKPEDKDEDEPPLAQTPAAA